MHRLLEYVLCRPEILQSLFHDLNSDSYFITDFNIGGSICMESELV